MPIYMQYGNLQGDVGESGHARWIELHAANWAVHRPATPASGASGSRALASARVTELVVSKRQDVATIPLIQEALNGTPRSARIDFTRTGQDKGTVYYSLLLSEVVITAFSQESTGDRPLESLTLNFTKITFQATSMDADGTAGTPSSYGWNLASGSPA